MGLAANRNTGGLIGSAGGVGATVTLARSYASVELLNLGTTTNMGGFFGLNNTTPVAITDSYWNSGGYATGIGTGLGVGAGQASALTTAQMASSSNFVGWDFATVWNLTGLSFPAFR